MITSVRFQAYTAVNPAASRSQQQQQQPPYYIPAAKQLSPFLPTQALKIADGKTLWEKIKIATDGLGSRLVVIGLDYVNSLKRTIRQEVNTATEQLPDLPGLQVLQNRLPFRSPAQWTA